MIIVWWLLGLGYGVGVGVLLRELFTDPFYHIYCRKDVWLSILAAVLWPIVAIVGFWMLRRSDV